MGSLDSKHGADHPLGHQGDGRVRTSAGRTDTALPPSGLDRYRPGQRHRFGHPAIQSGSPGAKQEVSIGDLDLDAVREFLHQLDAQVADLDLPAPEAAELAAEIDTIKAQVLSPKPKTDILASSLFTIQTILAGAAGNLTATGLLDLLQHIHL